MRFIDRLKRKYLLRVTITSMFSAFLLEGMTVEEGKAVLDAVEVNRDYLLSPFDNSKYVEHECDHLLGKLIFSQFGAWEAVGLTNQEKVWVLDHLKQFRNRLPEFYTRVMSK